MSKARAKPAPAPEPEAELPSTVAALTERCDHLAQQLQVQNDILEEIRQELQYLVTNGIEIRETDGLRMRIPVLKAMARNPVAEDWGEHLVINYGLEPSPQEEPSRPVGASPVEPPTNDASSPEAAPKTQSPTPPSTAKPNTPRGRLF